MTHQSPNDQPPAPAERIPQKIRFELSIARLCVYCFLLLMAFSWMFGFGVLIGRGLPVVTSEETSYRADFLRFLGLGREQEPAPEKVADTWDNPRKTQEDQKQMLQSLNYYEDLTQKSIPVPAPQAAEPAPGKPAPGKDPSTESAKQKGKTPPRPPAETPPTTVAPQPTLPEAAPPPSIGERFTLLIASLRDLDNAQKLVEQLKTKGYPARLESIDLNGGGRWNRVMVGSFENRDGALRFASEFNRKERTEGLVIRESN